MTCNDCLHFTVCEALEQGNGIKKVHPIQCGCFKDKTDVVKVVRCKDCKHCDLFYPQKEIGKEAISTFYCKLFKGDRKETDFCSYGELKVGENNV